MAHLQRTLLQDSALSPVVHRLPLPSQLVLVLRALRDVAFQLALLDLHLVWVALVLDLAAASREPPLSVAHLASQAVVDPQEADHLASPQVAHHLLSEVLLVLVARQASPAVAVLLALLVARRVW